MKDCFYKTFSERMEVKACQKRFPLRALFELTYACNFNCRHCYIPFQSRSQKAQGARRKELSTREVFFILDELKELGCFHLGFTGGEVFLRRDFFEILWHAKKNGFNLIILTNGSLIDKRVADELKKICPNKIDITLHSMNRVHFERITRTKGSYARTLRAIELIHQRGIPLSLKNCLLRENEADIMAVDKFCQKLGASSRLASLVLPRPDESYPEFNEILKPTQYRKRTYKPTVVSEKSSERHKGCGVGINSLVISPQGELKLCPHIDYPRRSILRHGLAKAWDMLLSLRQDIKESAIDDRAYGCLARSWLASKDSSLSISSVR